MATPVDSTSSFGNTMALSKNGNTALIADIFKSDTFFSESGGGYVFVRDNGSWSQQEALSAKEAGDGYSIGNAVALSADGTTALLGGEQAQDASTYGSAYVFDWDGTSWSKQQKLQFPGSTYFSQFGCSVALSPDGNTAVVGANLADVSGRKECSSHSSSSSP